MGMNYWFRVGMMCVSLFAVLILMRQMNTAARPGTVNPLARFFGVKPSHVAEVDLCPTRVTRIEAGPVAIFEEKMKWYRQGEAGAREKLDDVAVEKWFGRNCTLSGPKVSASADVQAALKVFFVSGEPLTLLQSATAGEYEWRGQPFSSPKMGEALRELKELPAEGRP